MPARCAQLLSDAAVEGALVPVIEYQRIPGISLVRDVCVGSRKEVRSVLLVSRTNDLKEVRSVALDETSRTSAALVKIVFREFLSREPRWTTVSPNLEAMLEDSDAALIIGDPAMTFPREPFKIWDMASLWREHTGLGFIFAMWMVSDSAIEEAKRIDFAGAREEGLSRVEEIVSSYQDVIPLSEEELRTYLTENIAFTPDHSMERGLRLYYELAFKHQLIENVKPLRFIES